MQKKSTNKGKILLNQENKNIFKARLEQQFQQMNNLSEGNKVNEEYVYVNSSMLISIIHKALNACKRSGSRKRATNTFPANPWYDEECKAAKRSIKEKDVSNELKKQYTKLIQAKMEEYVKARRKELISLEKRDPKNFGKGYNKGENKWRTLSQMLNGLSMQNCSMNGHRRILFLP